ncbi:MAG: 1-acyl-sn-glycerol-3-phosphate acyltransferase [Sandaracinaceae bacterium]
MRRLLERFHLAVLPTLRRLFGLVVRAMYRVRASGLEHIPADGPAIVVANHVSFVDALVIGGLCARPIRFVMDHRIHDARPTRWLFRIVRAIPIASAADDPLRLAIAMSTIERALADGEVVGIFPEGRLTRDGAIDRFRPGVERILSTRPVPVIPMALRGLWGSMFSYARGKPFEARPRGFRAPVQLVAGPAIPPHLASARALEDEVRTLRGALA